jgi:hypothetical protein
MLPKPLYVFGLLAQLRPPPGTWSIPSSSSYTRPGMALVKWRLSGRVLLCAAFTRQLHIERSCHCPCVWHNCGQSGAISMHQCPCFLALCRVLTSSCSCHQKALSWRSHLQTIAWVSQHSCTTPGAPLSKTRTRTIPKYGRLTSAFTHLVMWPSRCAMAPTGMLASECVYSTARAVLTLTWQHQATSAVTRGALVAFCLTWCSLTLPVSSDRLLKRHEPSLPSPRYFQVPQLKEPPFWREGLTLQDGVAVSPDLVDLLRFMIHRMNQATQDLPTLKPVGL